MCLLDEECQGICHSDAARILQMQSIKANVFRMIHATASAFGKRNVCAFAIQMRHVSY